MWRVRFLLVGLACALASVASAQVTAPAAPVARASELGILAGAAASSSTTGSMVAGTFDWDVNRWTAIEARASWLDRGTGASAFAFDLSALVNTMAKRSVTPFVGGGFGVYLATFESAASNMTPFYRRRLTSALVTEMTTFADPALRVSGGVDIIAHRSLSIRPEASLMYVMSGGRAERLVTVGLRLGYRFEDHPITP